MSDASAQDGGRIHGCVEIGDGEPAAGVNVVLVGTLHGAVTGENGCFQMDGVRPGTYRLRISPLDYEEREEEIEVVGGETVDVQVRLRTGAPDLEAVVADVVRLDRLPLAEQTQRAYREGTYQAVGGVLRALPGAEAGRVGSLIFLPSVRGLSGAQVATFADGAPAMPGAPLGLGTVFDFIDPFSIERLQVVKGPYALAEGGGLSAVLVDTYQPVATGPFEVSTMQVGIVQNRTAAELAGRVEGTPGRFGYVLEATGARAGAYRAGDGVRVPAGFLGGSARGQAFFDVGAASRVSTTGYYRRFEDVEMAPLRLISGTQEAYRVALTYQGAYSGAVRYVDARAFLHGSDHLLRLPEVELLADRTIRSNRQMLGARITVTPRPLAGVEALSGVEVRRRREDAGYHPGNWCPSPDTCLSQEGPGGYNLWPDVLTYEIGGFVQGAGQAFGFDAMAAGRLDYGHVNARALTLHEQTEVEYATLSAAMTVSRRLSTSWTASLGLGSATRAPSTDERFLFYEQAPRSNLVVTGNPGLVPERNTQVDLWLTGDLGSLAVQASVFARRVDNYITPDVEPPQVPASDARLTSGAAVYYGGELVGVLSSALGASLTASAAYVWAQRRTGDHTEAAFGIPPLSARLEGRLQPFGGRLFLAGDLVLAAAQRRVAQMLREPTSSGYVLGNARFGLPLGSSVALIAGAENLFNATYARHQNTSFNAHGIYPPGLYQDPPTIDRLEEPGRTFFLRVRITP